MPRPVGWDVSRAHSCMSFQRRMSARPACRCWSADSAKLRLASIVPRSTLLTYEGVYPTSRANAFWEQPLTWRQCCNSAMNATTCRVLPHVIRLWLHPGYSLALWKLSEWDVITGHPDVHRGSHANLLVSAST